MLSSRTLGLTLAAALTLSACSVSLLPGGSSGGTASTGSHLPQVSQAGAYRPETAKHQGGTIVIGTDQLPTALSAYFGSQPGAVPVDQVLFNGLLGTAPDFSAYGDLAAEVPSTDNGGIKQVGAGMDVTYKLRSGLAWSDGQPLTADDVMYTYQVITGGQGSTAVNQEGYGLISGAEKIDATTVVFHFRALYPAYRSLFSSILPRHRLQTVAAAQLPSDSYWTKPDVVSGPFMLKELAADHISLDRNPHYADGRGGMPFLGHAAYADQVTFTSVPSRQAVLAGLKAGDVEVALDQSERELPAIARQTGLHVVLTPSLAYEQVSLNQADPNPGTGTAPPWVGDPAVASALDMAVDRPTLERQLGARSPLLASPVPPQVDWAYDPSNGTPTFDLAGAKQLLEQDGWVPGQDGVRVKNGRRLAFALSSTVDQQVRIAERDTLIAGWRRMGADVQAQDFTVAQLFSPYSAGGVLARGGYEAALWSWITPPDPDGEFAILHSSSAPAATQPNGENYSRCHDSAVDQALASGRATLDQGLRAAAYRAFQSAYAKARCELPLYRRLNIGVTSSRLHGFAPNSSPAGNTWNMADWWLG
jgi:peptide/nickel transport system substrate-binding protein